MLHLDCEHINYLYQAIFAISVWIPLYGLCDFIIFDLQYLSLTMLEISLYNILYST